MRICLVHQYFKTPEKGGAIRTYYIAKYLQAQGHEVTVVTAGNNKSYLIDDTEGYTVHYLPIYYENHLNFWSRIHAFFLFVWRANKLLKKLGAFDLNYVVTTPLTTGLIALKAKKYFGTPYIFEVGDLWPDAPIALGILNNYWLKKAACYLELKCYKNAKSIIALSPDIKKNIEVKVPQTEVNVITNFADKAMFNADGNKNNVDIKQRMNIQGKLVISYLGTVGMANHLEYLLDIAVVSKTDDIHYIVAGSGAQFDKIVHMANQLKLDNISFFPYRNKHELQEIMTISDAIYVSFKNAAILSSGSPNKFFDGLAAGKLIIINFSGWVRDLIEQHQCGFYYPPEDPVAFIGLIKPYLESPALLSSASTRALHLADQFSPQHQLQILNEIIG